MRRICPAWTTKWWNWSARPQDRDLLASIFRTIHTIKGTCGFFGYQRLEAIAHITENILNELRNGTRDLDTPLASLLLAAVDAIKRILSSIEANQTEGDVFEDGLLSDLELAWKHPEQTAPCPAAAQRRCPDSHPGASGRRAAASTG